MTASEAALLVVDDNEDNRYTLTRRLNREGYKNLTMASNGREALDQLNAQPFDLVLLDIMMPDMNGYEVLEQVKATPALRDIPIIMISALDEIESVIRCIELGAEDYLSKPFNPTLLRARVGASLEKKRLRDEVRQEHGTAHAGIGFRARIAACHVAATVPDLLALASGRRSRRHGAGKRGRRGSVRLLLCRRTHVLLPGRRRVRQGSVRRHVHGACPQSGAHHGQSLAANGAPKTSIRERLLEAVNSRAVPEQRRPHVRDDVPGLDRHP